MVRTGGKISVVALIALVCLSPQAFAAADPELTAAIRAEQRLLAETGRLATDGTPIAAARLVAEIYMQRGFAPAWGATQRIDSLLEVVRSSHEHGLSPADYGLESIASARAAFATGRAISVDVRAAFDLLLTDSVVRLVYDLHLGKVKSETHDSTRDFSRALNGIDPAVAIGSILDADDLAPAVAAFVPQSTHYQRLHAQLRRYRALAEAGGWPRIPAGTSIRPGAKDVRLAILARRLRVSGDLAAPDAVLPFPAYDASLEAAVRRFQRRHGLDPDAIVGPRTLAALNVPVEQRIEQIRLNLERARWVAEPEDETYVLVNVAAFNAYVVRNGRTVWTARVIVGTEEDETPVFSSTLQHVVFNPTWTVPYRIASEELLPKIQRDPEFISRGGYELFDRAGNSIDPSRIDWASLSSSRFPYTLVQRPGPANELGRIKFLFPNEHAVCMHDTPSKALFEKARRAFSHGCVRVEEPFLLAEVLLGGEGWTKKRLEAQLESRETRTVTLSQPLPMLLLYRTAYVDDRGVMHFYEDVYERDMAILEALNRPAAAADTHKNSMT